ncbi:sugar transferase [Microcoleus sp. D2_18a_B4]|uniref:sugar transferase n=1 Tax=Microcoleus sp. D2_18a_B4 TaxID=3055329 RepID=UPI002FCFD4E8
MNNKESPIIKFSRLIKWLFDRLGAAIALLIFSPILLIVAIAIHIRMGSPVFFTQARPGKDSRIFNVYKFRTMTSERDAEGNLLPDKQRLTSLGQFLRKTSLDELPQLWNVLKGQMSFVGPRPLLPRYLPYFSEKETKRHDVLPGITGLAQINGRNHLLWDERLAFDVYYVENWSLFMDVKILVQTVEKVLRREAVAVVPSYIMKDLDDERKQCDG